MEMELKKEKETERKELGHGKYGTTFLDSKANGIVVKESKHDLTSECEFATLAGPFGPSCLDVWRENGLYYMTMKQCYPTEHFTFSELETLVTHLHDRFIFHHDLHADNIMRNEEGHLVAIDYGLSLLTNGKKYERMADKWKTYLLPVCGRAFEKNRSYFALYHTLRLQDVFDLIEAGKLKRSKTVYDLLRQLSADPKQSDVLRPFSHVSDGEEYQKFFHLKITPHHLYTVSWLLRIGNWIEDAPEDVLEDLLKTEIYDASYYASKFLATYPDEDEDDVLRKCETVVRALKNESVSLPMDFVSKLGTVVHHHYHV